MAKKQPKPRHHSLVRNRIVAIVSIALPLFVLGWMGLIRSIQQGVERKVKQDFSFTIELDKKEDKEAGLKMVETLLKHPAVAQARYISVEEAAKELQKELGEDPTVVLLIWIPAISRKTISMANKPHEICSICLFIDCSISFW